VVKLGDLANQAHHVEDILDPHRGDGNPPRAGLDAVLELVDAIRNSVKAIDAPTTADPTALDLTDVAVAVDAREAPEERVRTVRAGMAEMDELLDGLEEAYTQLTGLRHELRHVARARVLANLIVQHASARRQAEAMPLADEPGRDGLLSVGNELVEIVATVDRKVGGSAERVDRELRQVRDLAEQLRLLPASTMFAELERATRDVAGAQGKLVSFEAHGGDVRLDAHVLETVQTALQQIVRNAVAHGLETEPDRVAAGKPPRGHLRVAVEQRGRRTVFSCHDDGRGVDLDAVRASAVARGIAADQFDRDELTALLLGGGLSTSEAVTELSGRGIGLEIVSTSARRLHGAVNLTTTPGRGTRVEIDVPLSITAFDALIVVVAGVIAAVPLKSVRRTVRVSAGDIVTGPSGESLPSDGRAVPLVDLSLVLGDAEHPAPCGDRRTAVVVRGAHEDAGVTVERLVGTSVIVLRPLPDLTVASEVVAGVWIGPDGTPQIVLDPDGLVAHAGRRRDRGDQPLRQRPPVLVVDDSLTTRMLEQSILESAGFEVELASSGEEGLERVQARRFGVILVDVEMPGIDGFTFIERLKADEQLREIPCILVTSRGAIEDRQRGSDVGASAFVVKANFDQRELLAHIDRLLET
jgi:two-component system chemotaxis sensor kinase CheA